MTQDPHSDVTATSALTPATPAPISARRGRRFPTEISREGAALGVDIGLSTIGAAALLAGGLTEGGPLLTAGLACLGVRWGTSSQD